jgi:hypothetical protein
VHGSLCDKEKAEISDWLLAAEIAATVEEVDQAGVAWSKPPAAGAAGDDQPGEDEERARRNGDLTDDLLQRGTAQAHAGGVGRGICSRHVVKSWSSRCISRRGRRRHWQPLAGFPYHDLTVRGLLLIWSGWISAPSSHEVARRSSCKRSAESRGNERGQFWTICARELVTLDGRLNRRISRCKDSGPTGSHVCGPGIASTALPPRAAWRGRQISCFAFRLFSSPCFSAGADPPTAVSPDALPPSRGGSAAARL